MATCKDCLFYEVCADSAEKFIDAFTSGMELSSACLNFKERKKWVEKKEPMTTADRIRAMNDEELIKLLTSFGAFACISPDKDCEHESCEECLKEWLQSPAE